MSIGAAVLRLILFRWNAACARDIQSCEDMKKGRWTMESKLRVARRSNAILQAASGDYLLREQFVTDPAGIMFEYVHGESLPETAPVANHLLHALVSSAPLLSWMQELGARTCEAPLSDEQFAEELSVALEDNPDRAVIAGLMRFGTSPSARIEPAFELVRTVIGALGRGPVSGGTESTPGTGTESTPGTGTQSTPGTGTQSTPGTGTQSTPGTGTQSTPGTGTGTGTQSTPGTGTGTGTESTPGGLAELLRRDLGQFQVTLRALIDYSVQLRRSGALFEIGLG